MSGFVGKYGYTIYIKKGTKADYIEGLSGYADQHELLVDKHTFFSVPSRKGNSIET